MIDELTVIRRKGPTPVRGVTGLIADGVVPPARVVDRPASFGRRIDAGDDAQA